jgi:type II secretory pathway component PulM
MIAALASPLARWAVIGGVLIALAAGLYIKGRVDGSRLCDAAQVRAELAQARADLGRITAAAQDAHAASERLAQARKTDLEKIDAYEATLANRDACLLTDGDIERLRDILNGGVPNAPRRP